MTQIIGNKTRGSKNRSYLELLNRFQPRPITTEEQYIATQNVIDSLIDQEKLNQDEQDYLNLLGSLIAEYEQKNAPFPKLTGIKLIKALLIEMDLTEEALISLLDNSERVKKIFNKQAELSWREKETLAQFFQISADHF